MTSGAGPQNGGKQFGLRSAEAVLVPKHGTVARLRGIFGNVRIGKKERGVTVRKFDRNRRVSTGPAGSVPREGIIPFRRRLAFSDRNLALRKDCLCDKNDAVAKMQIMLIKNCFIIILIRYLGPAIIVRICPAIIRHRRRPTRPQRILIVSVAAESFVQLVVFGRAYRGPV